MDEQKLSEYLAFAKGVAKKAGEIMRQYSRIDQQVSLKADESPVTVADKAINSYLIEQVQGAYPEHGVLGEEESWKSNRDTLWVCDPIDGTASFIMHMPLAVFSLALVVDGKPIVANTYNPWTNDSYTAIKGAGAYRNEQRIHVSDRSMLEQPRLLSSSHSGSQEPPDHPVLWQQLSTKQVSVTRLPGTVFKGCLIAEGSAEGRIFIHDGAHDIAALKLIIEEAGGKVTDMNGSEQRYDQPINGAVMSNGIIHDELLSLIRQYENIRH